MKLGEGVNVTKEVINNENLPLWRGFHAMRLMALALEGSKPRFLLLTCKESRDCKRIFTETRHVLRHDLFFDASFAGILYLNPHTVFIEHCSCMNG